MLAYHVVASLSLSPLLLAGPWALAETIVDNYPELSLLPRLLRQEPNLSWRHPWGPRSSYNTLPGSFGLNH